uniref:Uncharacterized protein n=1 Tax=Anguilla anguilla TaxID=7936 RepID=A0A0E9WV37_ANGAN
MQLDKTLVIANVCFRKLNDIPAGLISSYRYSFETAVQCVNL